MARAPLRLAPVLFGLALAACSPASATLLLQLRTDYIPGQEFDRVSVTVEQAGAIVAERSLDVGAELDVLTGIRIAEIEALPTGSLFVTVELSTGAATRASRRIAIDHPGGILTATALISSDCADVMCPGAEDAALTECLGGRCVQEGCTPESPEFCPDAECESAADCTPSVSCVTAECVAGACFETPDDGVCGDGERCMRGAGCRPDAGSCARDLMCGLFDDACTASLGRRCAALGLLDGGDMEFVLYDPETGDTCGATSVDPQPGVLSGTPQLFGGGLIWASGACNSFSLSLDTGLGVREPSPCGLPSPLSADALAWVEQFEGGDGVGVVHHPDGTDVPFTATSGWGRLSAIAAGEAALDLNEERWAVLDLNSGEFTGTLFPPDSGPVQGVVRDGTELLWMMDGTDPEIVRTSADGSELGRVAVQDLPPLGTFARWVGIGCAL